MTSFSTQRFSLFARSLLAIVCTLGSLLISSPQLSAQSAEDLFKGIWQIDTPEDGALIIIAKSQGLASYFWGDNTDRSVYPGTWSVADETATLVWADGSQHSIARDSLGFGITYSDASGIERYTAQAQQVPKEILGQWAKPPARDQSLASDRDKAKGYFGVWQIGDASGNQEYVFVESDRSAASTGTEGEGLRGSWAKQGSELHIAWDTGHYSILREDGRTFTYKQIEPGQIIEEDDSDTRPAERVLEDSVPSTWLTNYRSERATYTGGIAFSSRKNARAFYRGNWIVRLNEEAFERIEIARFGSLRTSRDRSLQGNWRMEGQDIFMRWDNGTRKILSPIGRGFVIYEYKPGRPLDGVPTRLAPTTPADATKLAEHLKGRQDVAQQMVDMAQAAGIDPIAQKEAGWGRTFARWAWPFGEEENNSASQLLEEDYAANNDPWWWPFWSEKSSTTPSQEAPVEERTSETIPTDAEVSEASTDEATEVNAQENLEEEDEDAANSASKPRSVKDWVWPF